MAYLSLHFALDAEQDGSPSCGKPADFEEECEKALDIESSLPLSQTLDPSSPGGEVSAFFLVLGKTAVRDGDPAPVSQSFGSLPFGDVSAPSLVHDSAKGDEVV